MALPALLAILALVAYPLAFATYYSLQRRLPGQPGEFIGFENYSRILQDPNFAEALRATVVFTVEGRGCSFVAGLGLALSLSKPLTGRGSPGCCRVLAVGLPALLVVLLLRLLDAFRVIVLSDLVAETGLASLAHWRPPSGSWPAANGATRSPPQDAALTYSPSR
jgi:ABC-type sugar transport system permease subunit